MSLRFFKTYKVKCPDGTTKTVYRDINEAFPLYIPGWERNIEGEINAKELASGKVKTEYKTKIQGILFGLDGFNNSLMLDFRGIYLLYKNDPCTNNNLFNTELIKLLDEQKLLNQIKILINSLIACATTDDNNEQCFNIYKQIILLLNPYVPAAASSLEIKENRDNAKKWIGEKPNV